MKKSSAFSPVLRVGSCIRDLLSTPGKPLCYSRSRGYINPAGLRLLGPATAFAILTLLPLVSFAGSALDFSVVVLNNPITIGAPVYVEMKLGNRGEISCMIPFSSLTIEDAGPHFAIREQSGRAIPILRPSFMKASSTQSLLGSGDSLVGFFDPTQYVDMLSPWGQNLLSPGEYILEVTVPVDMERDGEFLTASTSFTISAPTSTDSVALRMLSERRILGQHLGVARKILDSLLAITSVGETSLRERAYLYQFSLALSERDASRTKSVSVVKSYISEYPSSPFAWERYSFVLGILPESKRGEAVDWLVEFAHSDSRARAGMTQFGTFAETANCPFLDQQK